MRGYELLSRMSRNQSLKAGEGNITRVAMERKGVARCGLGKGNTRIVRELQRREREPGIRKGSGRHRW